MHPSPHVVTELLIEWGKGNPTAADQLMPLVYSELHKLARRHMQRQNPSHTLQTTALSHEAFVRMAGDPSKQWKNRFHFFALAAKVMRQVLVDHARAKHSAKRGDGWRAVPLDEGINTSDERLGGLLVLDQALTNLAKLHPRHSEVVELRFFGGFSVQETAEILKVSPETVMLDWRAARAWLHHELDSG